jgi:hypothetical protein
MAMSQPTVEGIPGRGGGNLKATSFLRTQRTPNLMYDLGVNNVFQGGSQLVEGVGAQTRDSLGNGRYSGHGQAGVVPGSDVLQVQRPATGVVKNNSTGARNQVVCVRQAEKDMLLVIWQPGDVSHQQSVAALSVHARATSHY